jgi:hypothetical protein
MKGLVVADLTNSLWLTENIITMTIWWDGVGDLEDRELYLIEYNIHFE